jgi:hypothetical protein
MKKIMIACLSLSLLSGTAAFAQNTSSSQDTSGGTMKSKTKHKKNKKGETAGSTTSTSTSR